MVSGRLNHVFFFSYCTWDRVAARGLSEPVKRGSRHLPQLEDIESEWTQLIWKRHVFVADHIVLVGQVVDGFLKPPAQLINVTHSD